MNDDVTMLPGLALTETDAQSLSMLIIIGHYVTSNQRRFDECINWLQVTIGTDHTPPGTPEEARQLTRHILGEWASIQQDLMKAFQMAKLHGVFRSQPKPEPKAYDPGGYL
jgi:hypothetical protein